MGEGMLGQVNPLVGIVRITRRNSQRKPLTSSSRTLQEQMLRSLFNLLMAKSTIISFLQEFFLLLKMFLVFSLSFRRSQAKNFIVGIQFDFQTQRSTLLGVKFLN
jgi:hypothetical protein